MGLFKVLYKISATLSGPGWVYNTRDYENTVINATNSDIIETSDYFEVASYENGMRVVPYETAKGGAVRVYSIFVNYFAKKSEHDAMKQPQNEDTREEENE